MARKKGKAGWRLNGVVIYRVKGVKRSGRKTYRTKEAARRALRKRRK